MCGHTLDGLAEVYAPSLYHPYYLCLGTQCNCAFDPPAEDLKNSLSGGIGAAVDALRTFLHPTATDCYILASMARQALLLTSYRAELVAV